MAPRRWAVLTSPFMVASESCDFYIDGPTENNDWRNVQLPLSTANFLPEVIAQITLHECGHTMGLVPSASAILGGHNDCPCGSHYMDDGSRKKPLMRLGFIDYYVQGWMLKNERYLQFVFPVTP